MFRTATLLMLSTTTLAFLQDDYVLDFYRADIKSHNESYLKNFKVVTYKFNRTQPALNFSFDLTLDTGNDIEVIAQADKFVSNEYRDFPIRFQFNFCKGMAENHFGLADFYDRGVFSRCPMKQGHYYVNNWYPDPTKFPPLIPSGKYRLSLDFMLYDQHFAEVLGYAEILRPFNMKKKKKNKG